MYSHLLGIPVTVDPVSGFINMTALFQFYGRQHSDVLIWMQKPYILFLMDQIRRDSRSTTIIEADGNQNIWAHPAMAISVISIWSNTSELSSQLLQSTPIVRHVSTVTRGTQTIPIIPTRHSTSTQTETTDSKLDQIENHIQQLDNKQSPILTSIDSQISRNTDAILLQQEYLKTMADMLINMKIKI